jgi:hypothetical protein
MAATEGTALSVADAVMADENAGQSYEGAEDL